MAAISPVLPVKSKSRQHPIKIDMTPMVDLGFLLITFFIFTTSMAEPTSTKLIMPKDGPPTDLPQSKALTAVLDKDKVYLYNGRWEEAKLSDAVIQTSYVVASGFGHFIRQKQKQLEQKGQKGEMVLLIKPLPSSQYQNVVAALDEVLINGLKYYAVVDVTEEEKKYIAARR